MAPIFSNRRRSAALLSAYNKLRKFYGPQGWWPGRSRFEVIVGAILTQNTAWANVEKAIRRLKSGGYSLSSPSRLHNLSIKRLARLIRCAGYYNVKARRLRNFTDFLSREYAGSLTGMAKEETDRLRRELLTVNGIGQETCDSILLYAFNRPIFVVDAYTRRIFSRHGFFGGDSAYEEIQDMFMKNLPSDEEMFNEYHALIVRLGKDYCRKTPKCLGCPLKAQMKFLAKRPR